MPTTYSSLRMWLLLKEKLVIVPIPVSLEPQLRDFAWGEEAGRGWARRPNLFPKGLTLFATQGEEV